MTQYGRLPRHRVIRPITLRQRLAEIAADLRGDGIFCFWCGAVSGVTVTIAAAWLWSFYL